MIEDRRWEPLLVPLKAMGSLPSPEQEAVLRCESRIILLSGGEQAGKSYTAYMYLALRMIEKFADWIQAQDAKSKAIYWMVGGEYDDSRKEFDYLLEGLRTLGLIEDRDISIPQRGPRRFRAFERRMSVETKSSDDVRRLARDAPAGILINEAALVDYDVYKKCLGRTAPAQGFLFMSGTIESATDWYSQNLQAWQGPNTEEASAFIIPTWANRILYPKGRDDPEIKRIEGLLPPDEFMQKFGATPSKLENLCLPEFTYSLHVPGDIEFNKELAVQLWIDPGFSGSWYAVEVAQIVDPDQHCALQHVHIIDELYVKGAYTGQIIEECKSREWWEKVDTVAIDIAGSQHQAAPSHADMWFAEGVGVRWEKIGVEDGILRHRTFLRDPSSQQARIFFNDGCSGVTKEYGKWIRRKISGLVNQAAMPQIINCDGLKAIHYGLVMNFGYVDVETEPQVVHCPFPV